MVWPHMHREPIDGAKKILSVSIAGTDIDLGDEEDEDDESWWTQDLGVKWHKLDHDYYAVLGLAQRSANRSTVCSAYHQLAQEHHPENSTHIGARARRAALLSLYLVTEAFLVLRDKERKRIYDELGLKALRQSESYSAESVFEADPLKVYDSFFSGEDPMAREYLLTRCSGDGSSDCDDHFQGSEAAAEDDEEDTGHEEVEMPSGAVNIQSSRQRPQTVSPVNMSFLPWQAQLGRILEFDVQASILEPESQHLVC